MKIMTLKTQTLKIESLSIVRSITMLILYCKLQDKKKEALFKGLV